MNGFLAVMIGGALGAGGRYGVGTLLSGWTGTAFPWATLAVNLSGGLAMGLLAGTLARGGDADLLRLLLGVGVLGGFTTFSAFSLETVQMIARGEALAALAYVGISVIGSVALTMAGMQMVRA
jgi:fluoride exporter